MFRTAIASLATVLLLSSAASAQDVAATNPNTSLASLQVAVTNCEVVAGDPAIADSGNGICITATRDFLATVAPGNDDQIEALVIRLLELAQLYPECDEFDDEVATAVRAASSRLSRNSELLAQFNAAAEVIEQCDVTNLGALNARDASGVTPG